MTENSGMWKNAGESDEEKIDRDKKKDQNCIGKPILIKLCSTLIILEI